jgi:fibronectin-binding autotransporter adhesin
MSRQRNRSAFVIAAAAVAAVTAASASAADLFWQGGTGNLTDANYYSAGAATTNNAPVAGDVVYLGEDGIVNNSSATPSFGKLYVGHNAGGGATEGLPGAATLNVTGGSVATTGGATGSGNAGVIVGNQNSGTLNIDGGSSSVSSNQQVSIGYGNNLAQSANLNLTNGGGFTLSAGNFNVGDGPAASAGIPGHVTVAGTIAASGRTLQLGVLAPSSYQQSAGTATFAGSSIGFANADGTSYTLSGGNYNGTTMTLNAAQGTTDNISASVSGGTLALSGALTVGSSALVTNAGVVSGVTSTSSGTSLSVTGGTVTIGGALNVGSAVNATNSGVVTVYGATATNTSISFTGGSVTVSGAGLIGVNGSTTSNTSMTVGGTSNVKITGNFVLADNTSNATNTSLVITGSGHLTATGGSGVFIGRGTSANTTVTQDGGTFDITNRYLLASATNATGVVVTHSAGVVNTGLDLRVGDTGGTATYNLSGTGVLNATQGLLVGRQKSLSTFNQTGGTLNISGGTITTTGATTGATLRIGDAESATTSNWSTGTYNLSAGVATAALPTGSTATYTMTVGAAGTGTMRMIGDDGTLTVTGNLLVRTTAPGVGTLAFRLQSDDTSISPVTTTGFTTLDPGAVVQLEFDSLAPVQGVYTVVNSSDIVDNGATISKPAGWGAQIVAGGNGKILQFFAGDANGDGLLNADDYAITDRGRAKGLTGGANGDYNGDGVINAADYHLIDAAFITLHPGGFDPGFLAMRESEFGAGYVSQLLASVPEPSSLAGVAITGLALAKRRRRVR